MVHEKLARLVDLSARIGKNLDLVQAGGGNTSLKDDGTLWVKASGKWLSHAQKTTCSSPSQSPILSANSLPKMKDFPSIKQAAARFCVHRSKQPYMPSFNAEW